MTIAANPRDAGPAAQAPPPGLYLVSTPIGNLRDITLRALDVLSAADLVLAEDTRVTRKLLDAYGLKPAVEPYHEHNAARQRPRVLAKLADGACVALVSDAGTPLISDPGFKLVKEALDAGEAVRPVPGASASLAALVASGAPTDRFFFAGFAPAKAAARDQFFAELAGVPGALIVFEAAPRLADTLAAAARRLGDRDVAVARELTKRYEETRRGGLSALAEAYRTEGPPRGEIVLVISPADAPAQWDDAAVDAALAARLGEASLKDAAAEVAQAAGRPKREVYARALALKAQDRGD